MNQKGFTLTEISISLVVIGLIVAGVLKGQSMIRNARVHSLITLQSETQTAFNAFVDRYRALPGDYAAASTALRCPSTCINGNGNGRIDIVPRENILVWTHLSAAGFITGSFTYNGSTPASTENTPANPYGGLLDVAYTDSYANSNGVKRHNINLGSMIPSDVLSEVDRKIDDGNPLSGKFRFSDWSHDGNPMDACIVSTMWNSESQPNCGAVWIM